MLYFLLQYIYLGLSMGNQSTHTLHTVHVIICIITFIYRPLVILIYTYWKEIPFGT